MNIGSRCVCVCMSVCVKAWVCVSEHEFVCESVSLCVWAWVCVWEREFVCVSMSLCVRAWVCVCEHEWLKKSEHFRSVCVDIWTVKSIQHFYCFCTITCWHVHCIWREKKLLVYLSCVQNKWFLFYFCLYNFQSIHSELCC